MKFSLIVLTVGLLVAIAAAGPFSNVDVFGKKIGILGTNLEPTLQNCSSGGGIGTVRNFELTDSTGDSCAAEPCPLKQGQFYAFIYTIECGAAEITWKIDAVLNYIFPITMYPVQQPTCNVGQAVDLFFMFQVKEDNVLGDVHYELKLVGTDNLFVNTERCMQLNATVVPA